MRIPAVGEVWTQSNGGKFKIVYVSPDKSVFGCKRVDNNYHFFTTTDNLKTDPWTAPKRVRDCMTFKVNQDGVIKANFYDPENFPLTTKWYILESYDDGSVDVRSYDE